jgi:cytoskeletal protein CcmA (bactofilin family)
MKGFLGSGGGNSSKGTTVDTLIGRQTEILGDVRFAGGLHLDGKIKGNVSSISDKSASLSVSETGAIEGDVRVPTIMLNGSVIGDVRSTERLSLAAKAKVTGNVHYKVLQTEPGAQINGSLVYEGSEPLPALTHQKGGEPKAQQQPLVIGSANVQAEAG